VAVVYFRAGYSPQHYEMHKQWEALKMIECSKAIKTPSIGLFLAGMKCVQEYMTDSKNLHKINANESIEANERLLSVFGRFYKLSNKASGNKSGFRRDKPSFELFRFRFREMSKMLSQIHRIMF
jgi:hypothetical protein